MALWFKRSTCGQPIGRPIEEIAADLHRLQRWIEAYSESPPLPGKATKVAAAVLAYDQVLAEACQTLEIAESLARTVGIDREAERLRMEAALTHAGFMIGTARHTS